MEPNVDFVSQSLQGMLTDFLAFLPELVSSIILFLLSLYFGGVLSGMLRRALEKREADPEVSLLVVKITRWSIVIIGTIAALNQIGFDLTAFLAGLGVVGFTVGFAIQDVSKNFVAGILLLLQQPFDIDDVIEVTGFSGTVLTVNLRATEMRTFDGRLVQIPNADVFTSPIVNFTRAKSRRAEITVGVAYGSDLEHVRRTAVEAVSPIEGVMADPAPNVIFQNFGGTTIDFTIYFWVDSAVSNPFAAQDAGMLAINSSFEREGIEMPYPTQTILLKREDSSTV